MYFYVRGCDYHQTTGGFEGIEKVKEVFAFRRFPFEIPLVLEDSNFSAIKERNIVRKFFGKKETSLGLEDICAGQKLSIRSVGLCCY